MEQEFIEKYERLVSHEEQFSITKADLHSLVDEEQIQNELSYRNLNLLGGVEGLLERLNVNPHTGLCDDEESADFEIRKKTFGCNESVMPNRKSFLNCLFKVLRDKVIIFLLIAATVRLAIDVIQQKGKWFDYCSIYIVVIAVSIIVAITNYSKEKVFANFQLEIEYKEVRVLRNGVEKLIPKSELVVGDVLIVSAGDILPIDGIIIKAYSISIDVGKTEHGTNSSVLKYHNIHFKTSSAINFEEKSTNKFPIVLSGCKIVRGYASVLVLSVGKDTYYNKKKSSRYKKLRSRVIEKPDDRDKNLICNIPNGLEILYIKDSRQEVTNTEAEVKNPKKNKLLTKMEVQTKVIKDAPDTIKGEIINGGTKEITESDNQVSCNKNFNSNQQNKNAILNYLYSSNHTYNTNNKSFNSLQAKDGHTRGSSYKLSDENFHEAAQQISKEREQVEHESVKNKKSLYNMKSSSDNRKWTDGSNQSHEEEEEDISLEQTPLQIKLQKITNIVSKFGIFGSILVCLFFVITYFIQPDHFSPDADLLNIIFDAILYGIVIVVFAVPESLPLVVTMTLAFSLNKMREEKTMIKNLEACENMACVDSILTDYTGILTKNKMQVNLVFIEGKLISGRSVGRLRDHVSQDLFDFFCEGISINTIAFSAEINEYDKDYFGDPVECCLIRYLQDLDVGYSLLRNNLLRPIIDCSPYSSDSKISFTTIEMDEKRDYVRIYVKGWAQSLLDFLSVYIGEDQVVQQISLQHLEKIRKHCTTVMNEGGNPIVFCYRDVSKDHYNQTRTAYLNRDTEFKNIIVRQLTFICLVGIKDELRDDVKEDILDCQRAGVVVRMVSAQAKECAKIAAEKCGILNPVIKPNRDHSSCSTNNKPSSIHVNEIKLENTNLNENLNFIPTDQKRISSRKNSTNHLTVPNQINLQTNNINSIIKSSSYTSVSKLSNASKSHNCEILDAQEDLRKYIEQINYYKKSMPTFGSFEFTISDLTKFNNLIEKAVVISRAQAKDKFVLAVALRKKGHYVAITGDGVSDYLAMKTAHVGISMGRYSTDLSKSAADIILADDNFKSIVTAIVYGRNIFDSVRKFLQFIITATIVVVTFVILTAFPGINFFFYPNQLLWINLILNTCTAVCLSSESPDRKGVMNKRPYNLNKSLFTSDMIIKIGVQSLIQLILLVTLIFFAPVIFQVENDMGLNYREWEGTNGIHTTIIFNCVIYMQFFNAIVSRSLDKDDLNCFRGIENNKVFMVIQPVIVLFQIIVVSHGGRITRTKPLEFETHFWCFVISSLVMLTLPIVKYLPIKEIVIDDDEKEFIIQE